VRRAEGRDHLEGKIEINLKEMLLVDVSWIHLSHDRNKWRAAVNTVMNFKLHKMWEIVGMAQELLASQRGLYPMESLTVAN
jgi:hypothetical protein